MIIGAGPAGLTAALELLRRSSIHPLVLEKSAYMGGISRTVAYKGNRIDIGGHRFFSKSDRVMDWWMSVAPVERTKETAHRLAYQGQERTLSTNGHAPDASESGLVMLVRPRKSRIFFLRKLFRLSTPVESCNPAKAWRVAYAQGRIQLRCQRDAAHTSREDA